MQVNNNLNSYTQYISKSQSNSDFSDILEQMSSNLTDGSNSSDITQNFKDNIMQYGIMATITMMNNDKIKEQIERKRAELLKALDMQNMSPKDKAAALASIEDTLSRYKKELQENNYGFKTQNLKDNTLKKLFTLL
ncbi:MULTISPECIES: hypothetical protein [Campylobacter]|uniref:Uncharacterized protein n=1 Tax=Campylobacter porcelli TaxID=1660073 RepID=A0A1X9SWK7_9BACT|nr:MULTISPECIES: hypothetical protein [unclassified Campylobacter]MCR8678467.1 hypothetical protein [Campylobacter sp. RM19072]MCR8695819.1 hypothetical protein [Campylobacter sp. RM19073]MEE3704179.1 hypothetical protein [Campylobacter sp. CX2-8023-23]MEE3743826.1 hypothetical protein [Campylobacter sp. CX2-4855-23]MEE3776085.1 hypothetical protein [Campylobacter sp. CX2-4080-23]